jgi:hypothetical protein
LLVKGKFSVIIKLQLNFTYDYFIIVTYMKKAISILILGLMLYNTLGYYLVYLGLVIQAKAEMREKIEGSDIEKDLITMVFDINNGEISDKGMDFKNEDEFEYKGGMYDVVSSETKGSFVYFYCINDKNEESIQASLEKHVANHFSTDAASQKRVNTFNKNIVKKGITNNSEIQVSRINNNCLFFNPQIDFLITVTKEISTPPPKFS